MAGLSGAGCMDARQGGSQAGLAAHGCSKVGGTGKCKCTGLAAAAASCDLGLQSAARNKSTPTSQPAQRPIAGSTSFATRRLQACHPASPPVPQSLPCPSPLGGSLPAERRACCHNSAPATAAGPAARPAAPAAPLCRRPAVAWEKADEWQRRFEKKAQEGSQPTEQPRCAGG